MSRLVHPSHLLCKSPTMLSHPRATTALVALACLYSIFLLKGQTDWDAERIFLNRFKTSFAPYTLQDATSLSPGDLPSTADVNSGSATPEGEVFQLEDGILPAVQTSPPKPKPKPAGTAKPSASAASPSTSPARPADLALPNLKNLCLVTNWTPNFWLRCYGECGPNKTSFCGGLNNARNRLQTCVRWAIDSGAGLILPPVTLRGHDLVNVNGGEQCLDTWWDLEALQSALSVNCPQLQLRIDCDGTNHTDAVPPVGDLINATTVQTPWRKYGDPRFSKGVFRELVALPALNSSAATTPPTPSSNPTHEGNATVFKFGDAYLGWDYSASSELDTIRKELHLAIPFRKHLLELGNTISKSAQLNNGAFIGVHLRGESDWPANWGNGAQQMLLYEDEMSKIRNLTDGSDVSAVYVSSGDQQAIQAFRERLEPLNYTVHDKWTILKNQPEELAVVNSLDFDSMGIVDYAALIHARFYMGVSLLFPSHNRLFVMTFTRLQHPY